MHRELQGAASVDETIVAISTASGRSAIGIVRLSGSDAVRITNGLFTSVQPLKHRQTCHGTWHGRSKSPLDEVVVHFAQAPNSYTGQDLVEINAHGNPVVLRGIVQSIVDSGARLARPGEFTLRAMMNGKMDLIQAEAVREFIDAQTEHQARVALQQLEGACSKRVAPPKDELLSIIARLEAGIDFAEDDVDIPDGRAIADSLRQIIESLNSISATFGYGRILVEGMCLAIVGKPNVGKSSLFNRLIEAERAIVTDIPGTTRDVLSEAIDFSGIPLRVLDTAGIRRTPDRIESIGVGKSLETLAEADLALIVLDGSQAMDCEDEEVLNKAQQIPHFLVINKSDVGSVLRIPQNGSKQVCVSALTGAGMEDLASAIQEFVKSRKGDTDDFVITNARQYSALQRSIEALNSAVEGLLRTTPHEMILLDLYDALAALNELTGEVVTDDILNRIFSTFCIGK